MSNLQKNRFSKLDIQIVYLKLGGQWLICDNQHRKDNQLQSLKLPRRIPYLKIQIRHKESDGNMLHPIIEKRPGINIPGDEHLWNQTI